MNPEGIVVQETQERSRDVIACETLNAIFAQSEGAPTNSFRFGGREYLVENPNQAELARLQQLADIARTTLTHVRAG